MVHICRKIMYLGYFLLQVIDREADKISRDKIYSVLHNAGLVR